jgi:hypothetical protein
MGQIGFIGKADQGDWPLVQSGGVFLLLLYAKIAGKNAVPGASEYKFIH